MRRFTTTGRDHALNPNRKMSDACRRHIHGPIQPMPEPSFWQRLFNKEK